MRRFLPILVSLLVVGVVGYMVVGKKENNLELQVQPNIGNFFKQNICARPPQFLKELNISQPVVIDLSQKRFKGIAFHYGENYSKTLHPKIWEQYEYFSTYTVDEIGNIYLVPTPFISIYPTTFNLQKNIYKLDTKSGKLSIFMNFKDVYPSANNPYGINAIVYDCDSKTLWVAAIDESDYQKQRGVIYHIDIASKSILQKIDGFDVLSMAIIKSKKGKYLLAGSARDNGLYAYSITNGTIGHIPQKLLELPSANEHIRKIKPKDRNHIELQSIPFSYALIAQTAKKDRIHYSALWSNEAKSWEINKLQ